MKESKFRVGDRVICIDGSNGCKPILDKMCIITRVRESPFVAHSYGYEVMCNDADCESDRETTYWVVDENQLEPYIIQFRPQDCLTDPNIDYEKVSENPIYFEFVDIGKALNKLKDYEHSKQPECPVTKLEECALKYVVCHHPASSALRIHTGILTGVNSCTLEVQYEDGDIHTYDRNVVFDTYTEALAFYKSVK